MESERVSPGGRCPVRVLVDGDVPLGSDPDAVPLSPEDRETLALVTAPGSSATLSRAQRWLVGEGYKVGATALNGHRRRDCACP